MVIASWIIVVVHLVEAVVWASFFVWNDAMPSASISYYFALMEYTTVGSAYNLPVRWRLLEGLIAITGACAGFSESSDRGAEAAPRRS